MRANPMTQQQTPQTKAACLRQALEWGTTRSHLNTMMSVENGPEQRQQTLVATAQADAAEVVRLAALYPVLP